MKRVTDPCTIVDDLVPGMEYVFRVFAQNAIGTSPESEESEVTKMTQPPLRGTEFFLVPFQTHYELKDVIGR